MAVQRFEHLASRAQSVAEPRPINGKPRRMASDGSNVEKPARDPAGLNVNTSTLSKTTPTYIIIIF